MNLHFVPADRFPLSRCHITGLLLPGYSGGPQNILEEATRLCDNGTKEICLLGQNVNSYHANGVDFVELLQQLDGIKNLERIRFTSPHPKDFHPKLANLG